MCLILLCSVAFVASCGGKSKPGDAGTDGDVSSEVDDDAVGDAPDDVLDDCVPTGEEVCDGLDNDCNGVIDDGFDIDSDVENCGVCDYVCEVPNGTPACVAGECVVDTCLEGFHDLNGGAGDGCEYECTATTESESDDDGTCSDEMDNDCDGRVDVDDSDCADCYPEFCDTLDNDCDDLVDEDFNLTNDIYNCGSCGTACPPRMHASPACVHGECTIVCDPGWVNEDLDDLNGCEGVCVPDVPDETLCNGTDADCDGLVDEDYVPYPCGEGACEAESVCWRGVEDCTPYLPLSDVDTTCDDVDDDCDGEMDEDFTPTDLCTGLCRDEATCVDGVETCADPRHSTDIDCDGIDEDCDGTVDEEYVPYTCGSGGCIRTSTCIGGVEDCIEGGPVPEVCNGSDDNCSGDIDDGDILDMCPDPSSTPHLHIASYECPLCDAVPPGTPCAMCLIDVCTPGFYDVNGVIGDGCECQPDSTEDGITTCAGTTRDLGIFRDSDTDNRAVVTGNLIPEGDVDWFKFRAVDMDDSGSKCDEFHVVIKFLVNPGNEYQMKVYRDGTDNMGVPAPGCTAPVCGPELVSYSRFMRFHSDKTTETGYEGECPCDNTDWTMEHPYGTTRNTTGPNVCRDESATFWVQVSRRGSTVTCLDYRIEISNGYYATPLP
jgi:hypothetical protein